MESVADRLKAMRVSVTSPDNQIRVTLRGQSDVSMEFRPGCYERYGERALEHQCAQVATLVWTGYRRAYEKVITDAGMSVVVEPEDQWNKGKKRYHEIRRQIEGNGTSIGGNVRVKTLALLRWQVRIADGTIARLGEKEFIQEALSAVTVAIKDYRLAASAMREKYFGTGAVH